jgi:hypothetical protein
MKTVQEHVKWYYYKLHWNVIPAKERMKCPALPNWKRWQENKVDNDVITHWLKEGKFKNINLCLGEISDIYEIDVDVENAPIGIIQDICRGAWICESSNGKIKVFFKTTRPLPPKLDSKVNDDGGHIELRGNNHLSVLPPSIHPNGSTYTWLTNVEKDELRPTDGIALYNTVVSVVRAENDFQVEANAPIDMKNNGKGVRDFFWKSMKKGTEWNGQQGHYFRLAFCAELINNNYDDAQIHAFFKAHDKKAGERYSHTITQKKIDELRRKGMHCWSNQKIEECCKDILEDL